MEATSLADLLAQLILGGGSIVTLIVLFIYSDHLSDGNVGAEPDQEFDHVKFSTWLRTSNEAKPFRDAFLLTDQMPLAFGLKQAAYAAVEAKCRAAWAQTKKDLDL